MQTVRQTDRQIDGRHVRRKLDFALALVYNANLKIPTCLLTKAVRFNH